MQSGKLDLSQAPACEHSPPLREANDNENPRPDNQVHQIDRHHTDSPNVHNNPQQETENTSNVSSINAQVQSLNLQPPETHSLEHPFKTSE
ncbi:hypothetical protein BLNAU_8257 [Blattamonas nauphoetae]|uniref:Uncharacterized protein n=1 Tax=Blattamonas nauphoetae TaxID=2049346 RepID=A0ABQ9XZB2_9EUKA|nr:hypothetical protein BLNAU_8257 [Blattamonas nauphoetae]